MAQALCPSCGRPRVAAAECPHCGIIYAKHRTRAEKKPPVEAPPAKAEPTSDLGRIRLSAKQRQMLFFAVADLCEAGAGPEAVANSPIIERLPRALSQSLEAAAARSVPLARTLSAHGVLDAHQKLLVDTAISNGHGESAFRLLAHQAEERSRDSLVFWAAASYPALFIFGAVFFMPMSAMMSGGLSGYFQALISELFLVAIVVVFAAIVSTSDPDGSLRSGLRRMASLIPIVAGTFRHRAVATFFSYLGAALEVGASRKTALEIASRASRHHALIRGGEASAQKLEGGATLHGAMSDLRALSADDRAWIGHAERVHKLGPVLERAAAAHRRRSRVSTVSSMVALGMLTLVGTSMLFTIQIASAWASYFSGLEEQLKMIDQLGTMLGQ